MEGATCTGGVTVPTIPESVIGVEPIIRSVHRSRLTEIIFTDKWWNDNISRSITGTAVFSLKSVPSLPGPSCKCPDVLSRHSTHNGYTTEVGFIDCCVTMVKSIEGTGCRPLVGSDPTTHLTVGSSTDREED